MMFTKLSHRKPLTLILAAIILLCSFALSATFALAIDPGEDISVSTPVSHPMVGDDFGSELGIEWINDYPGWWVDTSYNDDSCKGLYDQVRSRGWGYSGNTNFSYSNKDAWEIDAKSPLNGGTVDSVFDAADLGMICAHGVRTWDDYYFSNQSAVYYSTYHTDRFLTPSDGRNYYGGDLEWLAFDSSGILSDDSLDNWSRTMQGVHLLLGFNNYMYRNAPGNGLIWGINIAGAVQVPPLPPTTMVQGWFNAVDYVQPGGTCARVLGERKENYFDYLWDYRWDQDYPPNDEKYYMDHCSTGQYHEQQQSQVPTTVTTMPVLQVVDRIVDEEYVETRIANAFNLSGPIGMDDRFYYMVSTDNAMTETVKVDRITGSFSYINISKLWVSQEITPTLPSMGMAGLYVDTWLNGPAENLPGAWYRNAGSVYTEEDILGFQLPGNLNAPLVMTSITPVDVSMAYPRNISVTAGTISGLQAVTFPIAGPGGRFKVYLGDQGSIIGAIGGSRDVQETGEQVTVLSQQSVWELFMADNRLAITDVTMASDTITYTTATLGYYEMSYLQHQSELIPVWIFTADFYLHDDLMASNVPVYLPAADQYIPPQVTIESPVTGSEFYASQPILFEGLITGGQPPYVIEWSASNDGYLGDSLSFTHRLTSPNREGIVSQQDITLQVTDANGQTGSASVYVVIHPTFWLPIIWR